jgi:hypothetical protein
MACYNICEVNDKVINVFGLMYYPTIVTFIILSLVIDGEALIHTIEKGTPQSFG